MLHIGVTLTHFVLHDLLHPLGNRAGQQASGRGYLFWSGIAGSFVLGGGIWANTFHSWRRHNCHAKRCPFIGRHKLAGTEYLVCGLHHPTGTPTAEQIHQEHHEAMRDQRNSRHLR